MNEWNGCTGTIEAGKRCFFENQAPRPAKQKPFAMNRGFGMRLPKEEPAGRVSEAQPALRAPRPIHVITMNTKAEGCIAADQQAPLWLGPGHQALERRHRKECCHRCPIFCHRFSRRLRQAAAP